MEIKEATGDDIGLLIPVLLELRPHLNPQDIRETFPKLMQEGYQVIYVGDEHSAYALAGFRTLHFFFSGKTLYIDDLATRSNHKRNGYAGKLLDWIIQFAKTNDYDHIALDSGFQRKDAYRLYLNKGLEVESLHFGRKVKELNAR